MPEPRKTVGLILLAIVATILAVIVGWVMPAHAQAVCKDRAKIAEVLAERFREAPVAMGVAANGSVVEVFATEDGENWTMVLTEPSGAACAVASGDSWQAVEWEAPVTGPSS